MTALLFALSFLVYSTVGAYVGGRVARDAGYGKHHQVDEGAVFWGLLGGVFWPIVMLMVGGGKMVNALCSGTAGLFGPIVKAGINHQTAIEESREQRKLEARNAAFEAAAIQCEAEREVEKAVGEEAAFLQHEDYNKPEGATPEGATLLQVVALANADAIRIRAAVEKVEMCGLVEKLGLDNERDWARLSAEEKLERYRELKRQRQAAGGES